MKIIELYIFKRIFIFFFAVLLAAVGLTWTIQVLNRIDFLTTSGQAFFTILKFSSLFIPSAVALVIPFALLIAVAQILTTMNQDSELVVINASGASNTIIWKPVLTIAVALSLLCFIIANFVVPSARINMRSMLASANTDIINVLLQENTFKELTTNVFLEIGERRGDGTFGHLFIADQRDPKIDLYYYAKQGAVATNDRGAFLVMRDGQVYRRDNVENNVSIIQFDSYTFDLSEFKPVANNITLYPKDQTLKYLFAPDPNDPVFQRQPQEFQAELHRRFSECLYPIVFALIALVVAGDARSHREARISASFSTISLSLFIYWLGYYFGGKADNDAAYIPLMYLIPFGVIITSLYMLLTHKKLQMPAILDDGLYKIFSKIERSPPKDGNTL